MVPHRRIDKPTPLEQDQLRSLAKVLPVGAKLIGGVSFGKQDRPCGPDAPAEPSSDAPPYECVLVIYDGPDGKVWIGEICGGGHDYEIVWEAPLR
jgi:hypothetical protein